MQEIRLRPLNELEERIRAEKVQAVLNMMQKMAVEMDDSPPTAIVALAHNTAALFESIGFVSTPTGVMARIENDILDAEHADAVIAAFTADYNHAMTVLTGAQPPGAANVQ